MQAKITIRRVLPILFLLGMKQFKYHLKRRVLGVGLMIMSGYFVSLAVVVGLISMFFALAHISNLVTPSLITSGVIVLIAILIGIQGRLLLK